MTEVKNEQEASTANDENQSSKNNDNQAVIPEDKFNEILQTSQQLAEALKKSEEEKKNYQEGMLSAKAKLKKFKDEGYYNEDDDEKSDDLLQKVGRLMDEKLQYFSTVSQPKPQEDLVTKLTTQVSELSVALKNRSQISSAPSGNSQESIKESKNHPYWSDEQIAGLKAKGLDPDKVWKNIEESK